MEPMIQEKYQNPFQIGEQVDCKDTVNKWLNAEIIAKRDLEVRVHYTQWSQKYDEWIHMAEERILKQWVFGEKIQINNRLDVRYIEKDMKISVWLEAIVLDIDRNDSNRVYIHFIDYKKKYDMWVNIQDQENIAEVGMHSKAHGRASLQKTNPKFQKLQQQFIQLLKNKEDEFRINLQSQNNWIIHEVESDGNCLFRSISHQIYQVEDYHDQIRQVCMDYISINKDYFQNFIIGAGQSFEDYVNWKRQDSVWGDNVEIQAMREIYERPIEIYAYSNVPMRTFSENSVANDFPPIRLSYHGQSHYNSIQNNNFQNQQQQQVQQSPSHSDDLPAQPYIQSNSQQQHQLIQYGILEKQALEKTKERQLKKQQQAQEQQQQQIQQQQQQQVDLNQARKDFEQIGNRNIDEAIKESFDCFKEKNEKELENQMEKAMQNDAIQQVEQYITNEDEQIIKQSEQQYEQEQIRLAAEQSRREQEERDQQLLQERLYEEQLKQATQESNKQYDEQLKQVLKDSLQQNNIGLDYQLDSPFYQDNSNSEQLNMNRIINQNSQNSNTNYYLVGDPMDNITIQQILNNDLNMDISLQEAVQAYEKFGENIQDIITYFCEKKL